MSQQYLCTYTSHQQTDWDHLLTLAKFAYNNPKHFSTGQTLLFLDTRQHPRSPIDQNIDGFGGEGEDTLPDADTDFAALALDERFYDWMTHNRMIARDALDDARLY